MKKNQKKQRKTQGWNRLLKEYGKTYSIPSFLASEIEDGIDPVKVCQSLWGTRNKIYIYVEFTKEYARAKLAEQPINRDLNAATVKRYADAMDEGRWRLGLSSINFDQAGKMCNGQHRLEAFLKSKKKKFVTHVLLNITQEDKPWEDIGRNRSMAYRLTHYLQRLHSPITPLHIKIINAAHAFSIAKLIPLNKKSVPYRIACEIADRYMESLDWTVGLIKEVSHIPNVKKRNVGVAQFSANIWRASQKCRTKKDKKRLRRFVEVAVAIDTPEKSEKWAWEACKKLEEIHSSNDKSKKLLTHGNQRERQHIYLVINECLYNHMKNIKHNPMKVVPATTEHFLFKEEVPTLALKEKGHVELLKKELERARKNTVRRNFPEIKAQKVLASPNKIDQKVRCHARV